MAVVQLPPPPPPEPMRPMHLHSGMKTPVKIVDVPPIYPTLSRNAHIQGVVILEAVLDAKGRVESVRVLRSVPTLDQAAVDAVQQWRFTPALLNGQPVPVVMTVTVNFTLSEGPVMSDLKVVPTWTLIQRELDKGGSTRTPPRSEMESATAPQG
jgi:TonB family protein